MLGMDWLVAIPGSTGAYGSTLHNKVQRLCDALIGGGGAGRKRKGGEREPGGAVASGSGEGGGGCNSSMGRGDPASGGDVGEDNAKAERSGGISPSPSSYDFCVLHVRDDGNAGIGRGMQAKVRGACVVGLYTAHAMLETPRTIRSHYHLMLILVYCTFRYCTFRSPSDRKAEWI